METGDGIVAFIRARLDEEERDALAATPGPWWWGDDGELKHPDGYVLASVHYGGISCAEEDEAHIARQNPAVTLARVEAIRGLVAWATTEAHGYGSWYDSETESKWEVLRRLAAFYRLRPDGSQHPDWRMEWEA